MDSPATDPEAAALADLRSTVKWLVGSAGATAVVLVGGLQLTRLRGLTDWAGVVSAVSAAVAICLALCLLTAAVRILAVPRLTSTQISNREINAGALDPNSIAPIDDSLVAWVRQHGEHLLAGERTVTDLCSLKTSAQRVARDLRHGRTATWQGTSIAPGDTEAATRISRVLRETDAALIAFENAVHHHRCQNRFTKLMTIFPWAAGLFVLAVMTFAITSSSSIRWL